MEQINNIELEDMRAQLALLKNKLDKEEIVNDRLLRETMKQKIDFINHKAFYNTSSSVIVIILAVVLFPLYGLSWWLVGYTVLMMLVCMLFTWIDHRGFTPDLMNGDLLTAAKRMRKLKKDYQDWRYIGYPMVVVWAVWLVWELLSRMTDRVMARGMVVGLIVGLVIGGLIGLKMKKNTLRRVDEIIEAIEK